LGSVGIESQIINVRIITDDWLPSPHRCYRYKYEVMETESPLLPARRSDSLEEIVETR